MRTLDFGLRNELDIEEDIATYKKKNTEILGIYNGNRTEWSPFRSAIIGVINKIG